MQDVDLSGTHKLNLAINYGDVLPFTLKLKNTQTAEYIDLSGMAFALNIYKSKADIYKAEYSITGTIDEEDNSVKFQFSQQVWNKLKRFDAWYNVKHTANGNITTALSGGLLLSGTTTSGRPCGWNDTNYYVQADTYYTIEVTNVGLTGAQGEQGKSAYQVWLDLGNTGTEQDFLNSIGIQEGETIIVPVPVSIVTNTQLVGVQLGKYLMLDNGTPCKWQDMGIVHNAVNGTLNFSNYSLRPDTEADYEFSGSIDFTYKKTI